MYFGMIGGFLFILIQLVLIIDFGMTYIYSQKLEILHLPNFFFTAHSWAEVWGGYYEETNSKGWFAALLTVRN